MTLSAPTKPVFLIAVILIVLGIVGRYPPLPVVSGHAFEVLTIGALVLVIATLVKGL